jgi:tetratricopeptide (TPR) repeat protein
VYAELGDREEAERLYEEALQIAREIGNRTVEGTTLNNLGLIAYFKGDLKTAKKLFDESLGIAQEIHNYMLESDVLNNLGLLPRRAAETLSTDLVCEAKRYQRFIMVGLVLASLCGLVIVAVWILHAFSLISPTWFTTLSLLGCLIGLLGGLLILVARQGSVRLRLNNKITE